MSLAGIFFHTFYEWKAKNWTYEEILRKLHENETTVLPRMENAADSEWNRARAVHVIGIERWGTHRLRVLLGEPLVMDEYDGYAPSEALGMPQIAKEFTKARAETIALVREMQSKDIPLTQTVKHNEVGDLSARGWLFYLENHMWRETHLLRQESNAKQVTQP